MGSLLHTRCCSTDRATKPFSNAPRARAEDMTAPSAGRIGQVGETESRVWLFGLFPLPGRCALDCAGVGSVQSCPARLKPFSSLVLLIQSELELDIRVERPNSKFRAGKVHFSITVFLS